MHQHCFGILPLRRKEPRAEIIPYSTGRTCLTSTSIEMAFDHDTLTPIIRQSKGWQPVLRHCVDLADQPLLVIVSCSMDCVCLWISHERDSLHAGCRFRNGKEASFDKHHGKGGKDAAPPGVSANGIDPVVSHEYHSYLKYQYSAPCGPVISIQYVKS